MFINWTETIGVVVGNATTTTTGSLFVTLLLIVAFIMAMAIMFGIRLEYTAIIILPLIMGYASYYSEFVTMLLLILIYLSVIVTKNFIFK